MEAAVTSLKHYNMVPAVGCYLILVALFFMLRPKVAFTEDGNVRPFGAGMSVSTIFPVWWWMFIFAVASYLFILWQGF
jgi:hypothetical protein